MVGMLSSKVTLHNAAVVGGSHDGTDAKVNIYNSQIPFDGRRVGAVEYDIGPSVPRALAVQ